MSKRSGSMGRRRSRSLAGHASKGLCETIPLSLPSAERLSMIIELSYQHALSVVQKEFTHKKDFDVSAFREKATECWEKIKVSIEEKKLVNSAVAEDVAPNESLVSENIGACNEAIAKYQEEHDKWSDQISHQRESLEKKIDSPYTVESSDFEGSDQLYDYSNVLKSAASVQDEISQQVSTLSSVNAAFSGSLEINKLLYNNIHEKVEKHFTHAVPDTPWAIIKNMANAKVTKP